jgi:hypothetical protein
VLGVDLIVIVAVLGVVRSPRRWVSRQPGAFKGAIRVVDGEVSGLGPQWRRGYGRWVREVLVWTKAPLMFQNELVAVDGLAGEARAAERGPSRRKPLDRDDPARRVLTFRPPLGLAGWGRGRVGSGWIVLGGELAVPCTRNPL